MQRKPRSDAKLKNLPREIQDAIIARMSSAQGEKASTSIESVIAWIKSECDVDTSAGALSGFWSWYGLRKAMELRESRSLNLVDILRKMKLGLSEDELMKIGNAHFLEEGVTSGDPKIYLATVDRVLADRDGRTRARQKDEELALKRKKLEREEKKDADKEQKKGSRQGVELTPDVRAMVLAAVDEKIGLKPLQ